MTQRNPSLADWVKLAVEIPPEVSMTTQRHYSPIDRLLLQADAAMRTLLPFSGQPYRPSPAIVQPDAKMSDEDTRHVCLLYTSPSPRDGLLSRMPSSA